MMGNTLDLKQHQKSALQQLKEGKRGVIFPYGFGKSPVLLSIARMHLIAHHIHPSPFFNLIVILCKTRNTDTWTTLLQEWAPNIVPIVLSGASTRWKRVYDEMTIKSDTPRALIISYSTIADHVDTHLYHLQRLHPILVIADESTTFKNPKARITKACLTLSNALYPIPRYILTGDLMPEGPHEVWSQLHFTGQNPFESTYYSFLRKWFIKPQYGNPVLKMDIEEEFKDRLANSCVWIGEEDAKSIRKDLGIPDSCYHIETYSLSDKQRELLAYLYEYWALPGFDNAGDEEYNYTMSLNTKAQQICSGFYYSQEETVWLPEPNPKIEALKHIVGRLLSEQPTRKIVIWRKYAVENDLLQEHLAPFGVEVGPISTARTRFAQDEDTHILIMPVDVSEGFNDLVVADVDIFFSNDFSQEKRNQAEKRIERPGNKADKVLHIDLCSTDGRDMEVITALQCKELSSPRLKAIINQYLTPRNKE